MSRRPLTTPYDPDRARRDYEDLGPLTTWDVVYLMGLTTEKRRHHALRHWYGHHGGIHAVTEWERLTAGITPMPAVDRPDHM